MNMTYTIQEVAGGRWLLREYNRTYASPSRAARAVQHRTSQVGVVVIDWYPATEAGYEAVQKHLGVS
jgi:hypothetical protein